MKAFHRTFFMPTTILAATVMVGGNGAAAQTATAIPSISTPDKVESRIGTLDFKDGAPSKATLEKVYDHIDFTHAYETFVNTMQGVSLVAVRKGFLDVGVKDNEILIFSELMDAKSLFLTADADTVYFLGFIDVSKGPMVLEVPTKALGALDDMWFRWVTDIGLPGPDGGKYLILPPDYDGPMPDGGYFIALQTSRRRAKRGPSSISRLREGPVWLAHDKSSLRSVDELVADFVRFLGRVALMRCQRAADEARQIAPPLLKGLAPFRQAGRAIVGACDPGLDA